MRFTSLSTLLVASSYVTLGVLAATLDSLCQTSYVGGILSNLTILSDVTYFTSNVSAAILTNYTSTPSANGPMWPTTTGLSFCNVTYSFTHDGLGDINRYLSNGGGGWSVSGSGALGAGLAYGAASGATDGGFGGFGSSLTVQLLAANGDGTIVQSRLESFAYQAIHELTVNGKAITQAFYGISENQLKSYYMGCSEGGREGHKSVQMYPNDFDGVVAGAPAMFFPIMQLAQGWPNLAMQQIGHWPSPCALDTIRDDYISACDGLDGKVDGILSRPDLCQYNASESIGKSYTTCNNGGGPSSGTGGPTNGTISDLDAQVVEAIYKGAFTGGNQIFYTYEKGTSLAVEAAVEYNQTTDTFGAGDNFFFGTYYQNLVRINTTDAPVPYDTFTVDTIFQLMLQGLEAYGNWTETSNPDLSPFRNRGGKLIHYHGGQDTNLYPQASAHYYEKVNNHMFSGGSGNGNSNGNYSDIIDFYRFFIVPGMGHCSINTAQPEGPFPQFALSQMIDWVEQGVAPDFLNGTTETGSSTQDKICMWPGLPSWHSAGNFSCVNDGSTATDYIAPLNGWNVTF